jgi:hypothetical protein
MAGDVEALLTGLIRPLGVSPAPALTEDDHLTAFATAGWHLRKLSHSCAPAAIAALAECGVLGVEAWSAADVARVLMLRRFLGGLDDDAAARLVERHFRTGDNAEREAVLKGLMALPAPQRFVATAADACRAAVLTTFTAIACENAYPARHFDDHAFRAMVVKALHLGVALARIHGLAERRDAELARMGADYASERRHAGRAVAADLSLITQEQP